MKKILKKAWIFTLLTVILFTHCIPVRTFAAENDDLSDIGSRIKAPVHWDICGTYLQHSPHHSRSEEILTKRRIKSENGADIHNVGIQHIRYHILGTV